MSDVDDFNFDDDETAVENRPLGLVVPTPLIEGDTLEKAEERFRKSKQPFPVLFTAPEDDPNGVETFDNPDDAERMRVVMQWPEGALPTVSEVEAWQCWKVALFERWAWFKQFGSSAPGKTDA